ncbi:MAG: hypothetical protein Q4D81_07350 [Eubacteriales bacterium]|nr:hypothetical protein [Eubacteriales bacterium]
MVIGFFLRLLVYGWWIMNVGLRSAFNSELSSCFQLSPKTDYIQLSKYFQPMKTISTWNEGKTSDVYSIAPDSNVFFSKTKNANECQWGGANGDGSFVTFFPAATGSANGNGSFVIFFPAATGIKRHLYISAAKKRCPAGNQPDSTFYEGNMLFLIKLLHGRAVS